MPTYSYRCTECENAFDIHQAFTEDSLTVCPACGGALRKVFSAVGVTFNGSGFYRTDSRSGSSSSDSSAPAAAPAKKESTSAPAASTPAASKPAAPSTSGA